MVQRFENGKMIVNHNKFMGYTKNENGDLVIVPEEAEIVRLIFRFYLEGYSAGKISQYLEENGIKTATGQDKWYDSVIFKMLRYDEKVKEKEEEMVALIAENARVGSYTDEFDERYRRIAEEITTLKEEQIEAGRKKMLADSYEQRLQVRIKYSKYSLVVNTIYICCLKHMKQKLRLLLLWMNIIGLRSICYLWKK